MSRIATALARRTAPAPPARDERRELWVSVCLAASHRCEQFRSPGRFADEALAAFDKTFPKGTTT